jgi:hypothetical protein
MRVESPIISPELRQRSNDPILGSWNVVGAGSGIWIIFLMTTKPDGFGSLL